MFNPFEYPLMAFVKTFKKKNFKNAERIYNYTLIQVNAICYYTTIRDFDDPQTTLIRCLYNGC